VTRLTPELRAWNKLLFTRKEKGGSCVDNVFSRLSESFQLPESFGSKRKPYPFDEC
jgi:hypothetical protein